MKNAKESGEHHGYYYNISDALLITILGTFCGLRDLKRIHQWATNTENRAFLRENFSVHYIPCYSWFTQLLGMIKPEPLRKQFAAWVQLILPDTLEGMTVSIDGKTICSTERMENFTSPLHIVSAHVSELGITFGQQAVGGKSNEIPTARELIRSLQISGCMVVADAMHCQKETAKTIIVAEADYLLSAKDNQPTLKNGIKDYVEDQALRTGMDTASKTEKNRERIEKRTAFVTQDISWLTNKKDWESIACIGAISTQFTTKNGTSNAWHYYISSRPLTALELLKYARAEWSVEAMHWLLDVNFGEDACKVRDENVQQLLNSLRKTVLNSLSVYKTEANLKTPISQLLFDNLLDRRNLLKIVRCK